MRGLPRAGGASVLRLARAFFGPGWQGGPSSRPARYRVAAAFVATNVESVIGAVAQDKYAWLTNELVNGIMTVIGAAAGMFIASLIGV